MMSIFNPTYWLVGLAAISVFAAEVPYHQKLLSSAYSCIEHDKEMVALVDRLSSQAFVSEVGSDDLRVKFVNLQGHIEHVLTCAQALGEIDQLIGVIHAPTPATPLCLKPDGDGSDLLDASTGNDQQKLGTVRSRSKIVREYLEKGGKLYTVYPQGGLERRNADQQKIYREALQSYPDHLVDWKLPVTSIAPDLIGATYLFRDVKQEVFAFSIKSRQANDIQTQSEWALWFGPVKDSVVAARVNEVFNALAKVGGPDLRREID